MNRKPEDILKTIKYTLVTRDLIANTGFNDLDHARHALDIIIKELNNLQKEYIQSSGNLNFRWNEYQFE